MQSIGNEWTGLIKTAMLHHMPRRPFIRKQKKKRHGTNFWDREYKQPDHLALSTEPGEDLVKFTRFLHRHHPELLSQDRHVVDLGCGNGRHLKYLVDTYGLTGTGFDTSQTAIKQAAELCDADRTTVQVRSIAEPLPVPDQSADLVLDMMTSHFLLEKARSLLHEEILRVLRPDGFLLIKTFLRDEDLHSARLLHDYPGPEPNTYIHPVMGVPEHVYSEAELREILEPNFILDRVYRSHNHRFRGKARKRRTITIYARLHG